MWEFFCGENYLKIPNSLLSNPLEYQNTLARFPYNIYVTLIALRIHILGKIVILIGKRKVLTRPDLLLACWVEQWVKSKFETNIC